MPALPYWFWPGDDRPTEEIDDEIAEELRLHLNLLEEEQARQGVPRDEAKRYAAEQFGDFDTLLRRCRAEKQGDLPMLKRIQAVLTLLLFVGVVFLGVRDYVTANTTAQYMDQTTGFLRSIQSDLAELRLNSQLQGQALDKPTSDEPYRQNAHGDRYSGTSPLQSWPGETTPRSFRDPRMVHVRDTAGQPIRNSLARVTYSRNAGFLQLSHTHDLVSQGEEGQFWYGELRDGDWARIMAWAPGYAFTSVEVEKQPSIEMVLTPLPSKKTTLLIKTRSNGKEKLGSLARVSPIRRMDSSGRTHEFIHGQSKIVSIAGEDGVAGIDWFAGGDTAVVNICLRGGDWQEKKIVMDDAVDGVITVWLSSTGQPPVVPELPTAHPLGSNFDGGDFGVSYGEGGYGGEYAKRTRSKSDLRGQVFDTAGDPVADADVLLIVKTWPNNRFRQDDYAVKTDASGKFELKGRIPLDGQYGINAAVVAKGQAIASQYVLVEDPAGQPPKELVFDLEDATETRIVITDTGGEPISKALVAPSGRVASDDTEHNVYHQGSNPVWKKTDGKGAVTVTWFAEGDIGKVRIRPRGGDWQEKNVDLEEATEAGITIAIED